MSRFMMRRERRAAERLPAATRATASDVSRSGERSASRESLPGLHKGVEKTLVALGRKARDHAADNHLKQENHSIMPCHSDLHPRYR